MFCILAFQVLNEIPLTFSLSDPDLARLGIMPHQEVTVAPPPGYKEPVVKPLSEALQTKRKKMVCALLFPSSSLSLFFLPRLCYLICEQAVRVPRLDDLVPRTSGPSPYTDRREQVPVTAELLVPPHVSQEYLEPPLREFSEMFPWADLKHKLHENAVKRMKRLLVSKQNSTNIHCIGIHSVS